MNLENQSIITEIINIKDSLPKKQRHSMRLYIEELSINRVDNS